MYRYRIGFENLIWTHLFYECDMLVLSASGGGVGAAEAHHTDTE